VPVPRGLRFIADRSQLILLCGALVIVVAMFGFARLAVEKSSARSAYNRAEARVDQLTEQNRLLLSSLEQARHGQRVAPKAYQYFGQTAPGVMVIVPDAPQESAPTVQSAPESAVRRYVRQVQQTWADGLDRLTALMDSLAVRAEHLLQF
jgi:hypothetical protein